jgi:2-phosphosulfolactate phosphatase
VSESLPPWTAQSAFDVRLCWGSPGVRALGAEAGAPLGALVVVDILRFTTALDVAVGRGACVIPLLWPDGPVDRAAYPRGTEIADASGPRRLSLSPATLTGLGPGDRVVLPSVNGSHCSTVAAGLGVPVVGASLRNAGAVAHWLLQTTAARATAAGGPGAIAVVACGERWPDGSLRPAVEDLLGAGAIVTALGRGDPARALSPEAAAARAAFGSARNDLHGSLAASVSGRELVAKGNADDIGWAAALDVSPCVPVLGDDGAYGDAKKTP